MSAIGCQRGSRKSPGLVVVWQVAVWSAQAECLSESGWVMVGFASVFDGFDCAVPQWDVGLVAELGE